MQEKVDASEIITGANKNCMFLVFVDCASYTKLKTCK